MRITAVSIKDSHIQNVLLTPRFPRKKPKYPNPLQANKLPKITKLNIIIAIIHLTKRIID
jgi:hypothetical protein